MQKMLRHRKTGAMYLYDPFLARHEDITEATDAEVAAFLGTEVEEEVEVAPKAAKPKAAKPKAEEAPAKAALPPMPPVPPAPEQE